MSTRNRLAKAQKLLLPKRISPVTANTAWQAAAWKLLSCACFACINGLVRYLSRAQANTGTLLPVYVIDFWQNLGATCLLLPYIYQRGGIVLEARYQLQHALRVLLSVAGVGAWYLTLKHMPVAKGVALSFLSPILTALGAHLWLNEKLDRYRLLAIGLSFVAAYWVLHPSAVFVEELHLINWAIFFPLLATSCFALCNLLTRWLARSGQSPEKLASYLLLGMTPVSFIPACLHWVWPQGQQWYLLGALSLCAAGAHWGLNKAYALAEVTFLMPIGFAKFIFSLLLAYWFFGEFPDSIAIWVSVLISTATGLLLNLSRKSPSNK